MQISGPATSAPTEVSSTSMFSRLVCQSTSRVIVMSSFPENMESLVHDLSSHCYDVLVTRSIEPRIIEVFDPEVLIVDTTVAIPVSCRYLSLRGESLPTLYLVPHRTDRDLFDLSENSDVLFWPTGPEETLHRMKTLIQQRRATSARTLIRRTFKDLVIDPQRVQVFQGSLPIDLTKTEFDLLWALVEAGGAVMSRHDIMDTLWGPDYFGGSNTIDVHIRSLRKKLGDRAIKSRYIVTVRSVGYRIAQ